MALFVVTAKSPQSDVAVSWYFDDMFEAEKAYALAKSEHGAATFHKDYISSFDEFERWFKGDT